MMDWAALRAAALLLWGRAFLGVITITEDHSGDALQADRVIARATWRVPSDGVCSITVYLPRWEVDFNVQAIITHEVGHCLGVNHTENQPGLMGASYEDWTAFSGYDRIAFWRVYAPPYRIGIPFLATE